MYVNHPFVCACNADLICKWRACLWNICMHVSWMRWTFPYIGFGIEGCNLKALLIAAEQQQPLIPERQTWHPPSRSSRSWWMTKRTTWVKASWSRRAITSARCTAPGCASQRRTRCSCGGWARRGWSWCWSSSTPPKFRWTTRLWRTWSKQHPSCRSLPF